MATKKQDKKPATKPKAAPLATPKPAVVVPLRTAQIVELGQLVRGPNVRKPESYKKKDLEELAESIAAKGVLQSLKVRPKGQKFETTTGGRRLTALEMLLEQKRIDASYPVPVLVEKVDDQAALEEGLSENIHRQDMEPLDEAEAFLAASKSGVSVEELAARSGKTATSVRKRLRLAEGLSDASKRLVREGKLAYDQAFALTLLQHEEQTKFLKSNGANFSPRWMGNYVAKSGFPVKDAIFKKEVAKGMEITEDLFGQVEPFYVDGKKARELQLEAAQALADKLKEKWAWAEVLKGSYWWEAATKAGYDMLQTSKDKTKAGAVVFVNTDDYKVEVREGIVKKASKVNPATVKAEEKRPKEHLTQGTALAAKNAKIEAVQVGVLKTSDRKVLELIAAALLGSEGMSYKLGDYQALASEVAETLKPYAKTMPSIRVKDGDVKPDHRLDLARTLESLDKLSDEGLWTLLRGLVAHGISKAEDGRWSDLNKATERPYVRALADFVEYDSLLPRRVITKDWLKGFQLERLQEIFVELAGGKAPEQKKDVIARILEELPKRPEYLPTELMIGEVETELEGLEEDPERDEDWEDEN